MIFYTGSYTQEGSPAPNAKGLGISCYDLDEQSGKISFLQLTEQRNPSYLVISADKQVMYAVEEMLEDLVPKIYAYRISDSGALKLINSQALIGDYACHLAIVNKKLLVANYLSGNVLSYPIRSDGGLAPHQQLIQHEGSGPNSERQEKAHAHMVFQTHEDQIFVVDLGIDRVKAYKYIDAINLWQAQAEQDIHVEAGAGPRHMLMSNNRKYAYIISELSGKVFVFKEDKGKFEQVQVLSIYPEGFSGQVGGAAIRMHPNGKFLYTSCRGVDVIAIFRIGDTDGTLEFIEFTDVEGKTPRDFNISPSGKWLIVANQDSDELYVFEVDRESGVLSKERSFETGSPVSVCW